MARFDIPFFAHAHFCSLLIHLWVQLKQRWTINIADDLLCNTLSTRTPFIINSEWEILRIWWGGKKNRNENPLRRYNTKLVCNAVWSETLPQGNLIWICMFKLPRIKCKHAIDDSNSFLMTVNIAQSLSRDQVTPSLTKELFIAKQDLFQMQFIVSGVKALNHTKVRIITTFHFPERMLM